RGAGRGRHPPVRLNMPRPRRPTTLGSAGATTALVRIIPAPLRPGGGHLLSSNDPHGTDARGDRRCRAGARGANVVGSAAAARGGGRPRRDPERAARALSREGG